MNRPRLGVNIDHVATLRETRGESYPSLINAANIVLDSGADQITIHLREDRRHIQDTDVEAIKLVTKKYGKPINLEMGPNKEITEIAIASAPDWVCLVPENREEKTTEGGLNLLDDNVFTKVKETIQLLKEGIPQLNISLFLEANIDILNKAGQLGVNAVEIHTGDYARTFLNEEDIKPYLKMFEDAKKYLTSLNIACHAGHGLTDKSLEPLLSENYFEEYNIGHWIISEAVFGGLHNVVKNLKTKLSEFDSYEN